MEFTCPICDTVLKTELPDDDPETTLPITLIEGVLICNTCIDKFRQAISEKKDSDNQALILQAKNI